MENFSLLCGTKENEEIAIMPRLVHKEKGSAGWNVVANTERKNSKKYVKRFLKPQENFVKMQLILLHLRNYQLIKGNRFWKKYSAVTTVKKENVGSKQRKINDLLGYIDKLCKIYIYTTELILFKKVMKLCSFGSIFSRYGG